MSEHSPPDVRPAPPAPIAAHRWPDMPFAAHAWRATASRMSRTSRQHRARALCRSTLPDNRPTFTCTGILFSPRSQGPCGATHMSRSFYPLPRVRRPIPSPAISRRVLDVASITHRRSLPHSPRTDPPDIGAPYEACTLLPQPPGGRMTRTRRTTLDSVTSSRMIGRTFSQNARALLAQQLQPHSADQGTRAERRFRPESLDQSIDIVGAAPWQNQEGHGVQDVAGTSAPSRQM
ncbi:hypothetical protein OH77DRAFT_1422476 [Trametes cingulata]|nr:hypothetical protein OH77DRAFT_1422476 [Trametes cingulata]